MEAARAILSLHSRYAFPDAKGEHVRLVTVRPAVKSARHQAHPYAPPYMHDHGPSTLAGAGLPNYGRDSGGMPAYGGALGPEPWMQQLPPAPPAAQSLDALRYLQHDPHGRGQAASMYTPDMHYGVPAPSPYAPSYYDQMPPEMLPPYQQQPQGHRPEQLSPRSQQRMP